MGPWNLISEDNRIGDLAAFWTLRLVWLLLPLTVGPVLDAGLSQVSNPAQATASVGIWIFWAFGFLSTLVPRPLSLTGVRLIGPAVLAIAVWAAARSGLSTTSFFGLATGTLVASLSMSASIGDRFVDGASYGNERRFLLRAPSPVAVILAPLTWLTAVSGVIAGPMIVANGFLGAGIPICFVGLGLAAIAARATHRLGCRWLVFVPTGLVLHDHLATAEPIMIPRARLARIGPAKTETDATDLTQGAFGLAIEVACHTTIEIALHQDHRSAAPPKRTLLNGFLCTPTRPDAVLAEVAARRLPRENNRP